MCQLYMFLEKSELALENRALVVSCLDCCSVWALCRTTFEKCSEIEAAQIGDCSQLSKAYDSAETYQFFSSFLGLIHSAVVFHLKS